jgi:hypothetical protein
MDFEDSAGLRETPDSQPDLSGEEGKESEYRRHGSCGDLEDEAIVAWSIGEVELKM